MCRPAIPQWRPPSPRRALRSTCVTDQDTNVSEYFWVNELERDGDRFSGRIDNKPNSVRLVQQGQVVAFTRDDIYDWMYNDDAQQRMLGNFTLRALLTRETPERAAAIRRTLGLDSN